MPLKDLGSLASVLRYRFLWESTHRAIYVLYFGNRYRYIDSFTLFLFYPRRRPRYKFERGGCLGTWSVNKLTPVQYRGLLMLTTQLQSMLRYHGSCCFYCFIMAHNKM